MRNGVVFLGMKKIFNPESKPRVASINNLSNSTANKPAILHPDNPVRSIGKIIIVGYCHHRLS